MDTSDVLDGYYRAPHAYILQHGIEILDHDDYANWAAFARQFEGDLIDGARYADRAGPPLELTVSFSSIFTLFIPVHDEVFGLCNSASLQHYYCPETGAGLNLSSWAQISTLVAAMPIAELTFLGGAVMTDMSISPPIEFGRPYPSAADRAQEEFDLAKKIYREGGPLLPERTPWASAMFHLGWACHFLADCSVSTHTVSDEFIGHDAYEKVADDRGAETGLHAASVGPDAAAYGLDRSVREMAVALATETRPELALYKAGKDRWDEGVRAAIPRAERYTACVLARFFQDVGLPREAAPLTARVLDAAGRPLPGAMVFFRTGSLGWSWVETDERGAGALSLEPGTRYDLRPAMPGYAFTGRYVAAGPTASDIPTYGCPVRYLHAASPIVPPTIDFYLDAPPVAAAPGARPRPAARALEALARRIVPRSTPAPAPAPEAPARVAVRPISATGVSDVLRAELRFQDLARDQLRAETMGWTEEIPARLWQNSARTPAYVKIQVQHLVDVRTGAVVATRGELASRASAPPPTGEAATGSQEAAGAPSPGRMAAFERLSPRAVPARDGTSRVGRAFPAVTEGNRDAIRAGLLPVPAGSGISVRVRIVPEQGHVGAGAEALADRTVVTDSSGVAWVRVKPGNQAGPLRLNLAVADDPGVSPDLWPARTVDLLVQPEWDAGKDVFPVVAPTLEQPGPDEKGWPGAAAGNPALAPPPVRKATVPPILKRPQVAPGAVIRRGR